MCKVHSQTPAETGRSICRLESVGSDDIPGYSAKLRCEIGMIRMGRMYKGGTMLPKGMVCEEATKGMWGG